MNFKQFKQFNQHFMANFAGVEENQLFEVNVDKDLMWETYLASFPAEFNQLFRKRSVMDCSCCRHFIKTAGHLISIKDGQVATIWDFEVGTEQYDPMLRAMSKFVRDALEADGVEGVFKHYTNSIGTAKSFEYNVDGVCEYNHFYVPLSAEHVANKDNIATIKGNFNTDRQTFGRALREISLDAIETVLDLINENMLYRGEEHKGLLEFFRKMKKAHMNLDSWSAELFVYENVKPDSAMARIRNSAVGTLLNNLSDGMNVELAVKKYEEIVAPHNYQRPKAIFTKKMLEDAQNKIIELGYIDSLQRRHATFDDLNVNNALHVNRNIEGQVVHDALNLTDIFAELEKKATTKPKNFDRVEEISIEKFINEVLPKSNKVEAYFENKHQGNMVSLIAPMNEEVKSMFKWDNGFSHAYAGNLTDSSLKENVKGAGGKVDGVLRFSIQWNDGSKHDANDLDAYCKCPNGNTIYFGDRYSFGTGGELDIDIRNPLPNKPAVENITFAKKSAMSHGAYRFWVDNFAHRGGKGGFRAEIEFDGQIFNFDYQDELREKERVSVAEVYFDGENFTIKELLPSTTSSKEIWGLTTNHFVPVKAITLSPNHWGEHGVGNKHYLFFLDGCVNPERPSGFFNEFLDSELTPHRRTFEALSSKMRVEDSDVQMSGVGFSSTLRNELVVKTNDKIMKIKF